jgi:hypothetical protein
MPTFRVSITAIGPQELGERMCFNTWGTNDRVNGVTWGALMPTYDGGDFTQRRPSDSERDLWASSVDRVRNRMAVESFHPRASIRSMFLPGTWKEPVNYDMEPPVIAPVEGGLLRAINPSALGPSALNPAM